MEAADFLELSLQRYREVRGEGAGRLAPPALVPARRARGGASAEFAGKLVASVVGVGGFIAGGIGGDGVGGGDGGHAAILVGEAERLSEAVYANANNTCTIF